MARRGTGEGSIYPATRDARGRPTSWRAAVVVGWVDGKPQRKYLRGATRGEVATKLAAATQARDDGVLRPGSTPTVAEWLHHWLDVVAADRLRESTRAGYEGHLRRYLVPLLGRHRLDKLRPEHIDRAWAELAGRGLAPATVRQSHRILSRALTIAVRRGHLARNPCQLIDGPAVSRAEVPALTPAQARSLVTAAAEDRLASRWTVAVALGLRQGEALGLAWDEVDLDAGTIRVRRAIQRQQVRHGCGRAGQGWACGKRRGADCPQRHGGGLVVVEPKSARSHRTVAMPVELVAQLRARRTAQLQERLVAGSRWRGGELGDLVWTQPDGAPIDHRADWQAWRDLCDRAGVPRLRVHDARHTAATLMLVQGIPARVVMGVLGHSTIQLTLDTYSHVVPELAEQAAAAMSTALWGPS
ncbi:site-specific integrase [Klenkia sp. LSe6-5]|uniref:Site-specific integrase n=1 Tax=Klenkia sesuvii TaxID=3103137 RepID=A0ABU8DYI6_9ACTN